MINVNYLEEGLIHSPTYGCVKEKFPKSWFRMVKGPQLLLGVPHCHPSRSSAPRYELMYQCWSADPKRRPTFTCLRMELESILGHLSVLSTSQDPLYINLERAEGPAEGGPLQLPGGDQASSGAGDGSSVGAAGGTPSDYRYILSPGGLAEQPRQEEEPPESPASEARRRLLQQQGLLPHSSC